MKIVILSDIWGNTSQLNEMANVLDNAEIIDPYQGNKPDFANEAQAYEYFCQHVGLDNYFSIAEKKLNQSSQQVAVIGFSIGVTILWRLTEDSSLRKNSTCNSFLWWTNTASLINNTSNSY